MTTAKPVITIHCSLKDALSSCLLSFERIAEVLALMESDTQKCLDEDGVEVKNAYIITKGGVRYLQLHSDSDYMNELHQKDHFASFLTPEEIKLLNDRASSIRCERAEQARFEKAEKVDGRAWGGWVVEGDTYHASVNEWLDDWIDRHEEGDDLPVFVWSADPRVVCPSLDVSDVVAPSIDAWGWEEMGAESFNGVAALQAALDAFVAANRDIISYHENPKKAILVEALCREALAEIADHAAESVAEGK